MSSAPVAASLTRRTVTGFGAWCIGVATSAPMVVAVGGIPTTYAQSSVTSLALLFAVVGAVIALLMVGYGAMLREVPHSAPYYAIMTRGISREVGVGFGALALLAYNAIEISLFGLLGTVVSAVIGWGAWWLWAALGVALVAFLGRWPISRATRAVAAVVILSLIALVLFVFVALAVPAGGKVTPDAFSVGDLFVPGLGLAIALTVAAYTGPDGAGSLVEEEITVGARGAVVTRGMVWSVLSLIVFYTVAAFAMQLPYGDGVAAAAQADPNLPITLMGDNIGGFGALLATAALVTGIGMSALSFHTVITRYAFAISREKVISTAIARSSSGTDNEAPKVASRLQSGLAAVVVLGFAVGGADGSTMFSWLSTLGAMGLLILLIGSSVAAVAHFSRGGSAAVSRWTSTLAPVLGAALGAAILLVMLVQLNSLVPPSAVPPLVLPGLIVVVLIAGVIRARVLKSSRPEVYAGISQGVPDTFDVPQSI